MANQKKPFNDGTLWSWEEVLLVEIQKKAENFGYKTIFVEAHEDKSLGPLLAPYLRTLLYSFDRMSGIGNKARRALSVLRGFIGSLKVPYGDILIGPRYRTRARICRQWRY